MDIFSFAAENNVAVIPFGGGTSVCGGVEAAVGEGYAATICLDMGDLTEFWRSTKSVERLEYRAACLDRILMKPSSPMVYFTTFPQSYRFSTIGGWVATRGGGLCDPLPHIDDLVESVRMVTPSGVIETRRLPGSGAGPSPDRG
ncbi:MAG: FAD-binding oxidoreductase [Gammaproteobacteria bacterium]|nr:FAD-binding oxidoreductase [Gammaproteobacteria bacterium]